MPGHSVAQAAVAGSTDRVAAPWPRWTTAPSGPGHREACLPHRALCANAGTRAPLGLIAVLGSRSRARRYRNGLRRKDRPQAASYAPSSLTAASPDATRPLGERAFRLTSPALVLVKPHAFQ